LQGAIAEPKIPPPNEKGGFDDRSHVAEDGGVGNQSKSKLKRRGHRLLGRIRNCRNPRETRERKGCEDRLPVSKSQEVSPEKRSKGPEFAMERAGRIFITEI